MTINIFPIRGGTPYLIAHCSRDRHGEPTYKATHQVCINAKNRTEAMRVFRDRYPERHVFAVGIRGRES